MTAAQLAALRRAIGRHHAGPLPPFRYRVDSLRVDADQSADPAHYRAWPQRTPVGEALHAFLTAELKASLVRPGARGLMRWPLGSARVVVQNPTREDLQLWSRAAYVIYRGCSANPVPVLVSQSRLPP